MTTSNAVHIMPLDTYVPCPQGIDQGYIEIPVPDEIVRSCQDHVVSYFNSLDNDAEILVQAGIESKLTDIACKFTDEEFVKVFIKGLRTFPYSVSNLLVPWIESDVKQLLGAERIALTNVSHLDQANNSSLSPEDYDFYWRCVRPNKNDVAGPHKDSQFAYLNDGSDREIPLPFEIRERWRIWFPLFGCHLANSIQLVKDSHKEEIPFTSVDTVNGPRPTIKSSWVDANEHRFECPIRAKGSGVLFRDDVVHRGPKNIGPDVRLSAEFTIVLQ